MEKLESSEGWDKNVEQLFIKLMDGYLEKSGKNVYETRCSEGIFAPALIMWLMMSGAVRGRKSLSESLMRLTEGDGELIRERNVRSKKANFSHNTGGLCRARERLP